MATAATAGERLHEFWKRCEQVGDSRGFSVKAAAGSVERQPEHAAGAALINAAA